MSGGTRSHSPKTRRWPQLGVILRSFDWAKRRSEAETLNILFEQSDLRVQREKFIKQREVSCIELCCIFFFGWRKLSRVSVSIDFLVGKELEASGKLEVLQQDGSCSREGLKEGCRCRHRHILWGASRNCEEVRQLSTARYRQLDVNQIQCTPPYIMYNPKYPTIYHLYECIIRT